MVKCLYTRLSFESRSSDISRFFFYFKNFFKNSLSAPSSFFYFVLLIEVVFGNKPLKFSKKKVIIFFKLFVSNLNSFHFLLRQEDGYANFCSLDFLMKNPFFAYWLSVCNF